MVHDLGVKQQKKYNFHELKMDITPKPHQQSDYKWFKLLATESRRTLAFFFPSSCWLTYINTNDIITLLYVTTLWSQPSSFWMNNFSVFGVSQHPPDHHHHPPALYWDVLLADKQWAAFRPAAVMGWQARSWSLNQTWPLPLSEAGLCHSCLMRGG